VLSVKVPPSHIGPSFDAEGVATVFTTTSVVPAVLVQLFNVTVTEYVPAMAVVTFAIVGFCNDDVNPFGPVQL
jgi:hypothetical protein